MASQNPPSRTFNTIKHSNREKRVKRHQQERVLLLAMCVVVVAILLTLAILLVCNVAEAIKANRPEKPPVNNEQNQPAGQQEIVYMSLTQPKEKVKTGVLQIVNQSNEYHFPTTNSGLKIIFDNRAKVNGSNVYQINGANRTWQLQGDALDALNTMMTKYYELFEDGSVTVSSAYRSYEDQQKGGYKVDPGFSDHHTGYCVALMDGTGSNKNLPADHWVFENCYKYGFIIRYPEHKSDQTGVSGYDYCFRYVGVAHATYIQQNNLCLEEYVEILKSTYTASNHLKVTGADGNAYEIYYVPAGNTELTTMQVPKNYAYTISGDNIGGFIVTVNLNAPVNA